MTDELAVRAARNLSAMRSDVDGEWFPRLATALWRREPTARLTDRELDVLRAASVGLERRAVADLYGISPETVKMHSTAARRRLRAKNTTHAVAIAIRAGLL
jgi:DNA-binding CsgD family transcriptional regulator